MNPTALWWLRSRLARFPALYWPVRRAWRFLRRLGSRRFAGYWDRTVAQSESDVARGWLDWELVERESVRPRLSGDPAVDYLEHFVRTHGLDREPKVGLSLACGGGNLERRLIELCPQVRIVGLDASETSIEVAKRKAREAGCDRLLDYRVEDLETAELGEERFDFVVAKMALHHLLDLEAIAQRIHTCLSPGGILMFNEYVGPDRFQWTDEQLEAANALLEDLPTDLKRKVPFPSIRRPTKAEVIEDDPSESIRSSDILRVFTRTFRVLERKDYGGTLLHLLGPVIPVLDAEGPRGHEILRSWMSRESELIASGTLPSDFVYLVAESSSEAPDRLQPSSSVP